MYTEISAALQGTKTLLDLVKAAQHLSNYSELLTAVTTIQQRLAEAVASELSSQEKQAELAAKVRDLEQALSKIEGWNTEISRYALFAFETGALAYALKKDSKNDDPMHYLCVTCADARKKSTLQPNGRLMWCPTCKMNIAKEKAPPKPPRTQSQNSWMAR